MTVASVVATYLQVQCEYCKAEVPFCSLETHYESCQEFPVSCSFGCDKNLKLTRGTAHAHMKVCPKALVTCTMRIYGCKEEVERCKLDEHLQICMPRHASDMCQEIEDLKQEVKQLKQALAAQQEFVQAVESNLCSSGGQYTWRVDNIRKKIELAQSGDQTASVIYSPSFLSAEAGYKLSLCIYPAGDTNQEFLSLYFVVMKGQFDEILQWPFQKRVYLSLLNTR